MANLTALPPDIVAAEMISQPLAAARRIDALREEVEVRLDAADTAAAAAQTTGDAALLASKRTVTIAFNNAALVAANSNGTAAVVNIGATLPANARILSCDARAFTPYSGASMSTFSLKIGTSGDDDAIISAADMLAAAVDGGPSTFTRGIRPNKTFITSGAQLIATLTPDGSHKSSDLTSGSIIIDVWFFAAA